VIFSKLPSSYLSDVPFLFPGAVASPIQACVTGRHSNIFCVDIPRQNHRLNFLYSRNRIQVPATDQTVYESGKMQVLDKLLKRFELCWDFFFLCCFNLNSHFDSD
jgi:hypothetical protein